jgi:hypothetical protein
MSGLFLSCSSATIIPANWGRHVNADSHRCCFVALAATVRAQGEKRIALLIGNQSYSAKIGVLNNPHADIALIGEAPGDRTRSLDLSLDVA